MWNLNLFKLSMTEVKLFEENEGTTSATIPTGMFPILRWKLELVKSFLFSHLILLDDQTMLSEQKM